MPPSGPITAWDGRAGAPVEGCPCGDAPAAAELVPVAAPEDAAEVLDCDDDREEEDEDVRDPVGPEDVELRELLEDGGAVGGGV